jgi:exoribonuclease-2
MKSPELAHRDRLIRIARRAMAERGLLPEFSAEVVAETEHIDGPAADRDTAIRDLRHLLWCSIDNDDSLDLDQLTVAETQPDGATKITIAIADVDALVKAGSATDSHAAENAMSVYTAAVIFPMLPERLSNDLSSLNEGQERLAIVVEAVIAADGTVTESDVYRALVLNHAKLSYDAVAAWLEGEAPAPPALTAVPGLEEQLRIQDGVAQILKGLRHERGALTLQTTETRVVFDGDRLAGMSGVQKNRAKYLIEDFMIAANGVTAGYLEKKGFPSIRRVLRSPERWSRIVELAAQLNFRLPAEPDAVALEKFLDDRCAAEPETFPDLSLSVIKLMGAGEYAVHQPSQQPNGHFGLAVRNYSHSTAPNRRYPDVITQRLLKAAMAGQPVPYAFETLDEMARHCTEQEGNVSKVERQVAKSAAALLLSSRAGDCFDGIVTGASEKGTWARIFTPPVEGKIVRGFKGLDVGDRVRVQLLDTDVERGFINFARLREK